MTVDKHTLADNYRELLQHIMGSDEAVACLRSQDLDWAAVRNKWRLVLGIDLEQYPVAPVFYEALTKAIGFAVVVCNKVPELGLDPFRLYSALAVVLDRSEASEHEEIVDTARSLPEAAWAADVMTDFVGRAWDETAQQTFVEHFLNDTGSPFPKRAAEEEPEGH